MAQLTIPQLVGLARSVGLSPQAAATSAAIAMAESSGRVDASGDSGHSGGLYQVYAPAHPDVNQGRVRSDPLYAAQTMKSISDGGTDWGPWTTFRTGAYKQYLPAAQRAAQSGGAPLPAGGQVRLPGGSATVTAAQPAGSDLSAVADIAARIEAAKPQPMGVAVPAPPLSPRIRLPGGQAFQLPAAPVVGAPVARSGSIMASILDAASREGQLPPASQVTADAPGGVVDAGPLAPRGGLGGTPAQIINNIVIPLARQHGIDVSPQSVTAANHQHGPTVSGGRSDHQGPSAVAWAADLSNGTHPTPQMDALAKDLSRVFGIPWSGSGLVSHTVGPYRVQLIYRTDSGGNHYNHVHLGIRRV